MKMKYLSMAILSSAAVLVSSVALAEAGQFYGTVEVVRSDIDLGIDGIDDTDTSFGLGVGYMINENFSVQVGYQDFGEISVSGNGTAEIEADAFQFSVLGGLPVSENAGVYAELGFDLWDADARYTGVPGLGNGSASDDGSDIYYGIGGYVMFNEAIGVTLEYQFHELDDVEIDTIGLGVSFTF